MTPQEYYQNFEQSVAEYNAAFDDYSARYDSYAQSLYREGRYLSQMGSAGARINQPGSLFQSGGFTGVVLQDPGTNRVYAQSGEVRQAQNIRKVDSMVGFGGTGQFQQTFRDPVSGLTFDITNRNTNRGVMLNETTYGFPDGRIIELQKEPTFDMQEPSFDEVKFQELLDEESRTMQGRSDAIEKENEELRQRQAQEQARFDAEMADFRRRSEQALIQIAEDTEEIEGRIESMAEATKRETERVDREQGARRAGYVRARTLRGRPLLS